MPFFARNEELNDTLLEPVLLEKVDPEDESDAESDEESDEWLGDDPEDADELDEEDDDEPEDDVLQDRFLFLSLESRLVFFVLLGMAEVFTISTTCLLNRDAVLRITSLPAAT